MATNNNVVKVGTEIVHTLFGGGRFNAKVIGIEKCKDGCKYGKPVSRMNLKDKSRNYVLDLDNNHWCYGDQVLEVIEN